MKTMRLSIGTLLLLVSLGHTAPELLAQTDLQWVSTWAAAQQERRVFGRGGQGQAADNGALENQTIRMTVRTSLGGDQIRVWLSNAYGTSPLTIGAAHVALGDGEARIEAGSDRVLTFNGMASVSIPPGAPMVSDPVELGVEPLDEVTISLYLPDNTGSPTTHSMGLRAAYVSGVGNLTSASTIDASTTVSSWYWVSGVDVLTSPDAATIVAFGDSITDGATSTPEANASWPSVLAERLASDPGTRNVGIVNLGISGNRLLADGAGVSALARFDRDVLSQPGVGWVMIMEGINDIGATARGSAPEVSANTLIGALTQMARRARTHGIRVIGCTLTPFEGAGYFSDTGEAMRQAVNDFIRTSGEFDAVVDFDAVIRDPANPSRFRPDFTNGDNLHPNDAGYRAMAESIDLSLFR